MQGTQGNLARVLVTGGSGFIGSHLCAALLLRNSALCIVDTRPPQIADHQAHFIQADMMDEERMNSIIAEFKPTAIYNLAACTDVTLHADALKVNTLGCNVLVHAVQAANLSPLIVHISSQLVVRPGYTPTNDEDFAPYTEYGESKAESERIFHRLGDSVRWTILRPTNVWGPRHATFHRAIWKYIGKRWYVHPTGRDPIRSYGYIENVIFQMLRVAELPAATVEGHVMYVGDEPIPSAQWLDAFSIALTGKPARRIPLFALKALALAGDISGALGGPRPIDRNRLYRMTTDYRTPMEPCLQIPQKDFVTLEEGVRKTAEWLRTREAE
jgi:GlcNAc-P-P-Und epimerase